MGSRVGHRTGYHAWQSSTPVIDVIRTLVAFVSVVIGSYAGLFLLLAVGAGKWDVAADNALFFVFIAVANAAIDAARRWRRHHA